MDDPSDGVLREWAPLSNLLQQIPQKAQKGLFTQDINFTCIDALPDFIAIGTNVGLVYWYNRKTKELQRLRCEDNCSVLTCVKTVSTVDYMVAAGSQNGVVTVFQVPKIAAGESVLPSQNKQVERYTVSGLHTAAVTAVVWSLNGMKLFSGDKNGIVVLTQIDFYMHLSKSSQLLDEKFEVVQLSYSQQLLLVSSLLRTILCHPDEPQHVSQVGQRERKALGHLGASFCPGPSGFPQEQLVYSCRPGLRVWVADRKGVVHQTLIFKEALLKPRLHVQLMNPAPPHVLRARSLTRSDSLPVQGTYRDPPHSFVQQFGRLVVFRDRLLVTSCGSTLYVLDPQAISVVATADELRGILDVATTRDEIFVLEGSRSLIRLAYAPEPSAQGINGLEHSLSPESHLSATAVSSLKDLTTKIPFQKILARLTPSSSPNPSLACHPEENPRFSVLTADEALEVPPIVALNDKGYEVHLGTKVDKDQQNMFRRSSSPAYYYSASKHLLDSIGQQEFEEVLFKPSKTRRKKKIRKPVIVSGTESGSDTVSSASALSADGDDWMHAQLMRSPSPSSDDTLGGPPCQPLPLPDLRSPDSIERDVAEKEWKLAEVLGDLLCLEKPEESLEASCSNDEEPPKERTQNILVKQATYDSSTLPSARSRREQHTAMTSSTSHPCLESNASTLLPVTGQHPLQQPTVVDKLDRWVQFSLLEPLSSISVSNLHVCCVGAQDMVRYSSLGDSMGGLQWRESEWRAQDVRLTQEGTVAWRVHRGVAFRPGPDRQESPFMEQHWIQEARGVKSLAVTNTQGGSVTSIPSDFPVSQVTCLDSVVWVVTAGSGQLWQRAGISEQQPAGTHWLRVPTPGGEPVCEAVLGAARDLLLGWVVDRKYSIYFSHDAIITTEEKLIPSWWQVLVSSYIFQQTSPLDHLRSKILENLSQQSEPLIAATNTSLWISSKGSTCVYMNNTEFIGHRWDVLNPFQLPSFEKWLCISAEGSFEDKGQQWFLTSSGELHCARPHSASFHVSPSQKSYSGRVMIRQGLCDASPVGHGWKELDLAQIKPLAHFIHVSCGVDAAWACDNTGAIYMVVYAGPESYMVWALDNRGNIYVREAVFPDFPVGISWVLVTGIEATQLTISATGVWALCPKGGIYRRYGISENNYIGDYWKKIPGCATSITSSVDDHMWAVGQDGRLLVHNQKIMTLLPSAVTERSAPSQSSDSDWEVV
ncbi:hypothetical protein B566_EDAN001423 [Ephemera danica]|nr:hypothetical protein B566_EDAN001423 [Ephemera danica]